MPKGEPDPLFLQVLSLVAGPAGLPAFAGLAGLVLLPTQVVNAVAWFFGRMSKRRWFDRNKKNQPVGKAIEVGERRWVQTVKVKLLVL